MSQSQNKQLHEAQVRVTSIVHLGSMFTDMYTPADPVIAFLEGCAGVNKDAIPERLREFFALPEVEEADDRELAEGFAEWTRSRDMFGFIVEAQRPKGSWGVCRMRWFYGDTYDEVIAQLLDWAKQPLKT